MKSYFTHGLAIILAFFAFIPNVPTFAYAAEDPPPTALIASKANSPPFTQIEQRNSTGSLYLTKLDEHGQAQLGWEFEIYSDSSCLNRVSGPYKPDKSGNVYVTKLSAGSYWIRESHKEKSLGADMDQPCPVAHSIKIEGDTVSPITILSSYNSGSLRMNNDNQKWAVSVYMDKLCSILLPGSPFKYEGNGILSGLEPGVYFVKEFPISKTSTDYDPNIKTVSIKDGESANMEFNGTQYGSLLIKQINNTSNHLEGWIFRVTDWDGNEVGKYVTDKNGKVEIMGLKPGRYSIIEQPISDPYWQLPFGFHTVKIEAGNSKIDIWKNIEQGLVWFTRKDGNIAAIQIFADKNCTNKVSSLAARNSGRIGIYLDPGTYFAKEDNSERIFEFQIISRQDVVINLGN